MEILEQYKVPTTIKIMSAILVAIFIAINIIE